MSDFDLTKLNQLDPEARKRVEDALKRTLETELATGAQALEPQAFSRSKGPVFSRSKANESLRGNDLDKTILRDIQAMDQEKFSLFAERLATLKRLSKQ